MRDWVNCIEVHIGPPGFSFLQTKYWAEFIFADDDGTCIPVRSW